MPSEDLTCPFLPPVAVHSAEYSGLNVKVLDIIGLKVLINRIWK
jgi:hypothetical protein